MPQLSNGKYVVVGGASLLGSHIGEQLLAAGAREVVLADNLSLGTPDTIAALLANSRCTFARADMTRLHELLEVFEGADGIFSVAGFLGAPMAANPWAGVDVNVRGVQNVLEAARHKGVKKVVFSSSVGVYGAAGDEPNTEASPLRWEGMAPAVILYCASKIMGEGLGRMYHQQYGLDFLALRYSALYGERLHRRALDATRMIEAWERVRAGQRPRIEGTGEQVQDYVYIGDVARANLLAMESAASGQSMNICTGEDVSLKRLVQTIIRACGSDLEPEYFDDPAKLRLPRVPRQDFSRQRAKELIGWEPQVSIDEGIRRLVAWLDAEAR